MKWINAREQKPLYDETIIFVTESAPDNREIGCFMNFFGHDRIDQYAYSVVWEDVSFWMPISDLPAIPTGDNDGK